MKPHLTLKPLPSQKGSTNTGPITLIKPKKFLIESAPGVYVGGFNGGDDWEFTTDRKTAWRMNELEVKRRLERVQRTWPTSTVVPA